MVNATKGSSQGTQQALIGRVYMTSVHGKNGNVSTSAYLQESSTNKEYKVDFSGLPGELSQIARNTLRPPSQLMEFSGKLAKNGSSEVLQVGDIVNRAPANVT